MTTRNTMDNGPALFGMEPADVSPPDAEPDSAAAAAPSADTDETDAARVTGTAGATGAAGATGLDLRMSLEAVLVVAVEVLAEVTGATAAVVAAELRTLADSYTAERRGFDLREVAGGWRLYTRDECSAVVERFVSDGQEVRLTQAALETLAVVAYRQPVSRARVAAVRGVNSDGVMRTLMLRGLVEEAGSDPETGAILFQTTGYFLERLGLARLSDLPDLVPFLPDHLEDELDSGRDPLR